MNAIGFLDAFYRAKHDQTSLLNELGGILASESAAVRLIPFGCEAKSVESFDHRAKGNRHATLVHHQDRLSEFRLDYTFTQACQEHSKSGRFFVLQHPDYPEVFVAFTVEPSVFCDKALMPFLTGLYAQRIKSLPASCRCSKNPADDQNPIYHAQTDATGT